MQIYCNKKWNKERALSRIDDKSRDVKPIQGINSTQSRKDRTNFNTNGTMVYTE